MIANSRNWTPAECEFYAENEMIEIIPSFRGAQFEFISGTYGPFKPAKPVQVPLWLAVYLKQRKKCDVVLPNWVDVDFLKKVRHEERELKDRFSPEMPYYYFEVANLLLNECTDEF